MVRDYFLQSPPDIILNVVDARNLYRGLGLTLQLGFSSLPMVVCVSMVDEARRQAMVPLIFVFIAKEIVIGGLVITYGGADPATHMTDHISALQALSFMLFCLLYTPCVAIIATI